jgi:hypothetical protein
MKKMCNFVAKIQVALFFLTCAIRDVTMARRSRPKLNTGDLSEIRTHLILQISALRFLGLWPDEVLMSALTEIWKDLTFEDVQAILLDWMEQFSWVVNNNEYY